MNERNFLMFLGREKHDLPKYHKSYNHNLPKIIKNGHFLTCPKLGKWLKPLAIWWLIKP